MPGKKAGAKKKTASAAKRSTARSTRKSAAARPARSKPAKRTAKKTTKTAKTTSRSKSTSRKKVSSKRTAQKPASKKKTVATVSTTRPAARKVAPAAKKPAPAPAAAAPAPAAPRIGSVLNGPLRGFKPYQPKRGEQYMSDEQREHFRQILLAWKRELMEEVDRTVLHMKDEAANFPDPNDRATQESEFGLELRTRDRERKLLKKIDSALMRIQDGTYGYCEETGDEIGLRRLEARPVATLCVEAQERRELAERQFGDRDDQYR